jgi:hypothetical protein
MGHYHRSLVWACAANPQSISRKQAGDRICHAAAIYRYDFLNALLLFWMQPLFVRMVLPLLGGAPAVWNTAMVFFQTGLLAGYAYAHFINARLPARAQVPAQMLVMALPLAVLPVAVAGGAPPVDANPIPWLIWLMTLSVGLPFLPSPPTGRCCNAGFP